MRRAVFERTWCHFQQHTLNFCRDMSLITVCNCGVWYVSGLLLSTPYPNLLTYVKTRIMYRIRYSIEKIIVKRGPWKRNERRMCIPRMEKSKPCGTWSYASWKVQHEDSLVPRFSWSRRSTWSWLQAQVRPRNIKSGLLNGLNQRSSDDYGHRVQTLNHDFKSSEQIVWQSRNNYIARDDPIVRKQFYITL